MQLISVQVISCAGNLPSVQLISVQVISRAGNLPSVQLISVQVISRAGNCMQVIGSSKSDSGNFHAVKQSLPKSRTRGQTLLQIDRNLGKKWSKLNKNINCQNTFFSKLASLVLTTDRSCC